MSGPSKKVFNVTKESVFVVGNGPSLAGFDFNNLRDVPWVGMNAAYRHWEKINCYPTFYSCLDLVVGLSHQKNIEALVHNSEALGIKSFLLRDNLISNSPILLSSPKVQNFDRIFEILPQRVFELITTGSHSVLWMEHLGFDDIILLGIDASYEEIASGATLLDRQTLRIGKQTSNSNYYFSDYQREGDHYTLPNPLPEVHLGAWRRCAQYLKQKNSDVRVFNGSDTSEIDSFPFISVIDLFEGEAEIVAAEEKLATKTSRAIEVRKGSNAFDLSAFLNELCPLFIGQFEIVGGLGPRIQGLKNYGWTEMSNSNFNKGRAVSSFLGGHRNKAAIGLTECEGAREIRAQAELFVQENDTVLLLVDRQHSIQLFRYPCKVATERAYILAFKSLRFWNRDLESALKLSVSDKANNFPWRHKLIRRLRTLLSSSKFFN